MTAIPTAPTDPLRFVFPTERRQRSPALERPQWYPEAVGYAPYRWAGVARTRPSYSCAGPFSIVFSDYPDGPVPEDETCFRDMYLDHPNSQDQMGIRDGKLAVVEFRGADQDFVNGGGRRGLIWRDTVTLTDNVAAVYDDSLYEGIDPALPAFSGTLHVNTDPSAVYLGISCWFVPPPFSWAELGCIGWEQEDFTYLDLTLNLPFPEPGDDVRLRSVGGYVSVEINGETVLGPCPIPPSLLGSSIHGAQIDVALDSDEGLGVMNGVIIEEDSAPLTERAAPLTPDIGTSVETASATTIDVPYPANIEGGEDLYCVIATRNGGTFSASGWSTVLTQFGVTAGIQIGVLRKEATGAESGSLTVTKNTAGIMAGVMFRATGVWQRGMSGQGNSASTSMTAPATKLFGPYRTLLWLGATAADTNITVPSGFFPLSTGLPGGQAIRLAVGVVVADGHADYPDPPFFNAYDTTNFAAQTGTAATSTTSAAGVLQLHPDFTPAASAGSSLLLEDGFDLLQETGSLLLQET